MFKFFYFARFFIALILSASFFSSAALPHAVAASASTQENRTPSSIFKSPENRRYYNHPAESNEAIQPLPSAAKPFDQPDALSLSWELYFLEQKKPAKMADAAKNSNTTLLSEQAQPDKQKGQNSTTLILPAAQKNLPDWFDSKPIWLFINIKSNVPDSYFYAPFAKEQSKAEQLASSKAILPTELHLIDKNGEEVPGITFYYPSGTLKEDSFSGMRLPVYLDEIIVAATIPASLAKQDLSLKINALICTQSSCTPFRTAYKFKLNKKALASGPLKPELIAKLAAYRSWPFNVSLAGVEQDNPLLRAIGADGASWQTARAEQNLQQQPTEILDSPFGQASIDEGLASYISALSPQYHVQVLEVSNIWRAALLGLLAGFILNFMPCVLPVISLKLSTLVGLGGWTSLDKNDASARHGRRRFRLYGLFFTLGVFVWFGMLFGVIGFAGMMWGQFFQSQKMLLGLAILLFVLALSMFDLVRIPLINIKVKNRANLPYQAFFGGLLATILATPCSGPLLGGVLGWAINQSLVYLGIALLAVATGMSFPFILMIIRPSLARFLPKPGPWSVTLERVMGFILLATVLYLLSMVEAGKIFVVLSALLVIAFSAWIWSRPVPEKKSKLGLGRILALILIIPALYFPFAHRVIDTSWKNFNAESFQANLGKQNIMLDFTADWCINCRALELTTLNEQRLLRWGKKYNLSFIKVDLTGNNPEGQALLDAMGSASIPLLAIIPAHNPTKPVVLRDLVTPSQLDDALKQTFKK